MTYRVPFYRRIIALGVAASVTAVTGSVISSVRVINALRNEGALFDTAAGLNMIGYDLVHFAPLYGLFILIAFLIAFTAGHFIFKAVKFGRAIIALVAGAVAILVMLHLMKTVFFGVPIVAGARDTFGLSLQMAAGGLGSLVYAALTRTKQF